MDVSRPWYLTKENVDPGNVINNVSVSKINRCPFNLTHLERLRIYAPSVSISGGINWNELLANYPKLCHLEILFLDKCYFDGRNRFRLPASLKTIYISQVTHTERDAFLNAPQLENVYVGYGIRLIKFSHPESIRHLEIDGFGCGGILDNIIYPNVEFFYCGEYSTELIFTNWDLIQLFPKVREIHFKMLATADDGSIDKLQEFIDSLKMKKIFAGGSDLDIFCNGKKIPENHSIRMHLQNI